MDVFINFFQELDDFILELITSNGRLAYLILSVIIFSETGLVIMAFLPGDSLLFVTGTLTALGTFKLYIIIPLLIGAAVLGNTTNYFIGKFFGNKIINAKKHHFINKDSIRTTAEFYEKHGSKTVVIAQFIPLARSAAPFLAGTGSMHYRKFIIFNIIGAIIWVTTFVTAGYLFGNVPFIKNNLSLIVVIVVSFVLILAFLTQVKLFIEKRRNNIKNKRLARKNQKLIETNETED